MPRQRKMPPGLWKRGRVYHARFRANGREVRKRLSTNFAAACQLLNDLRARADKADFGLLDNGYPWTALKIEFLKWAKQSLRPAVSAEYERDLKKFESYCAIRSVAQIQPELIFAFRQWRLDCQVNGKAVTPRTVNRQVGTIHNMLSKGVTWKRIGFNPIEAIVPLPHDQCAKERRSLTLAEVEALFVASPPYLKPVWRMLMCTGIRRQELIGLTFSDVDLARRTVTVRAAAAKSHKSREIPLDDCMWTMLAELQQAAKNRQPVSGSTAKQTEQQRAKFSREHVFVTQANTPLRNNLLKRFYAICKRAGIEDAHPGGHVDIHALRVSFTTLSLEHGANPKAVQAILGHATLGMTMKVYARATEAGKRQAVGALPFASLSEPPQIVSLQKAHKLRTTNSGVPKRVAVKGDR